jgi:NAD-dependent dihydropyrimidine dehydrogenase PreA subunit
MVAIVNKDECIACGICVDACAQGAITVDDVAIIDPELCVDCGACVDECPNNAISL